jgi:hypothetical protein
MRSHDQGFVGATPSKVYELLADLRSYASWWPGARATSEGVSVPLRRRSGTARADRLRDRVGLHLVSEDEDLEWYLEPFDDGTIVNVFLEVPGSAPGRRGDRQLLRMRSAVRRGLVGLKRSIEEPA